MKEHGYFFLNIQSPSFWEELSFSSGFSCPWQPKYLRGRPQPWGWLLISLGPFKHSDLFASSDLQLKLGGTGISLMVAISLEEMGTL